MAHLGEESPGERAPSGLLDVSRGSCQASRLGLDSPHQLLPAGIACMPAVSMSRQPPLEPQQYITAAMPVTTSQVNSPAVLPHDYFWRRRHLLHDRTKRS